MSTHALVPWTAEDDEKLRAMTAEGKSSEYMGRRIDRTAKAVASHLGNMAKREKYETQYAADIPCLQCGNEFHSPDRRLVRRCKRCHSRPDDGAGIFGNSIEWHHATRARAGS